MKVHTHPYTHTHTHTHTHTPNDTRTEPEDGEGVLPGGGGGGGAGGEELDRALQGGGDGFLGWGFVVDGGGDERRGMNCTYTIDICRMTDHHRAIHRHTTYFVLLTITEPYTAIKTHIHVPSHVLSQSHTHRHTQPYTIQIYIFRLTYHHRARGEEDEDDVIEEQAKEEEDGGLEGLEGDGRLFGVVGCVVGGGGMLGRLLRCGSF